MANKAHLLVVDDDRQICVLLQEFLQKHDFKVSIAHNGKQMQQALQKANIDLIVLDIMLPGSDGLVLCKSLRETSGVPIIMLSAMGDETDRIVGLEVGADDYLPKPFNPRELLARIKALLRRATGELATSDAAKRLAAAPNVYFLNWTLDCNKRCLIASDGLTVPLSNGEYELLLIFIRHPGRVLSRDQLLDLTSDREYSPFDRAIDVQVGRLRKKIELDPKNPGIINTVRGGGYQFMPEVTIAKL